MFVNLYDVDMKCIVSQLTDNVVVAHQLFAVVLFFYDSNYVQHVGKLTVV